MADNAEQRELKINQSLDALDDLWEAGPDDGEDPAVFLGRLAGAANVLAKDIDALQPEDVDEIYIDDENGEDDEV